MAKPTRFTQDMIDEYFSKGLWTEETTSDLWDRNAKLYPDKEAFIDSKKRLTWSQLKVLSDRFAYGILDLGFKRDELIFVLLPNWVESYIMRCACEKAGVLCGTALMTLREREIENILKSFNVVGVAIPLEFRRFHYFNAINEIRPRLPRLRSIFLMGEKIPSGTLSIENMMQQPLEEKYSTDRFRERKYKPAEVQTIAFTSGTTGTPKGAEHVLAARMALGRAYGEKPKINEHDIVLNIIGPVAGLSAAFCYNGSATLVGAKVVLLDIWSPDKTLRLIQEERVTILLAVPAQLAQIVRQPDIAEYDLSSLRCICTSTAPLPYTLARDLEETFEVPVLNIYGQVDGGIISGVSIDDPPEVRRTTVGRPHWNTLIALVDDEGNEVSLGEAGEIVYTGPTTSSGYFKDREGTLRVWGTLGRDGRCRSGDLAIVDRDGYLNLVGRKRDIINRGGQNIYPAEIEGLLLTHTKLKNIAIVPMPDPVMGERACAYVTLASGENFTFEEMVSFLKDKRIAPYKLPERLEIRDELPLTDNQKVAKGPLREDIIQRLKSEGKL
jgi:non-ribosomal peptide synthetase component E (peptide arylation enzyme)